MNEAPAAQRSSGNALLAPFSRPRTFVLFAAITAAVLAFFNQLPGIDRTVSGWFLGSTACATPPPGATLCPAFTAGFDPMLGAIRQVLQAGPFLAALALGIWLVWLLVQRTGLRDPRVLAGSAVFWTYVVSVGLIANVWLKSHWGRPRPVQTDLFGGDLPFVPAGATTGQCQSNCSFVSGEASSAFWLICLAALLPAPWRPAGFVLAFAFASFTAGLRVAFGGHYLSDVTLAGLITLTVFCLFAGIAAGFHRRAAKRA